MKIRDLLLTGAASLVIAAGLGCTRTSSVSAEPAYPRPVILFVHGRGHAPGDSAVARAQWLTALREGARSATGDAMLADGDVRNVWYADALDPRSDEACGSAAARDGDPITEANVAEGIGAFGRGLLGALLDLVPDTAVSPLQALAGDIMYLADDGKRCAAERRLDSALALARHEGRDVVVVAHSMGGLVAYRALRAPRASSPAAPAVRRLVTLGTPLAMPIVREVTLGSARLAKPAGVGSWINVRDPDDPFAPAILPEATGAEELSLAGTGDAERAHDAIRYLRDARAARSVLRAWCEGFRSAAQSPDGCRRLTADHGP